MANKLANGELHFRPPSYDAASLQRGSSSSESSGVPCPHSTIAGGDLRYSELRSRF